MPRITVVLPIYNSKTHLREALDSLIQQTYTDWELLAINEYGSDDGSAEIVKEYECQDERIKMIQNSKRLGLAESLNVGIKEAAGEYIARMDADDISHRERFKKEVEYLDAHPEVCVVGTWQHHFGKDTDWIHKSPTTAEQCKANLLFFCDLCHSTLMLRKKIFMDYHLFYDPSYLAEDFELWTRVVQYGQISNIPEVLGEYRWGESNITLEKLQELQKESGRIVAKTLKNGLGINISETQQQYFGNWENPFRDINSRKQRQIAYKEFEDLLRMIVKKNRETGYYDEQCLLNAIGAKWRNVRYYLPFNKTVEIKDIDDIFKGGWTAVKAIAIRCYYFWKNNKGIGAKLRKIRKKLM